jgi:predicted RNase H-like HicB family nuclease
MDIYLAIEEKKLIHMNKMLSVTLRVFKGEKMLVASNGELGIVTQGKDWNSLMKNIRDVIETYFDIPSADSVKINLEIDPMVNENAETASC